MNKEEQTDQVKEELYNLTQMFVRAYQPRYYIQYKGLLEDLVMDFYIQFLTEKSRVKGKEQSLLDKFDPSITTLPYLVKVSVIRMLIDRSRSDKREISIDFKVDQYGDLTLQRFNLIDEKDQSIDEFHPDADDLRFYKRLWSGLEPDRKIAIREYYKSIATVVTDEFSDFIQEVMGPEPEPERYYIKLVSGESYQVFQLTDKSIQLVHKVNSDNVIVTYNRETGKARGNNDFALVKESLAEFLGQVTKNFKLKVEEIV